MMFACYSTYIAVIMLVVAVFANLKEEKDENNENNAGISLMKGERMEKTLKTFWGDINLDCFSW